MFILTFREHFNLLEERHKEREKYHVAPDILVGFLLNQRIGCNHKVDNGNERERLDSIQEFVERVIEQLGGGLAMILIRYVTVQSSWSAWAISNKFQLHAPSQWRPLDSNLMAENAVNIFFFRVYPVELMLDTPRNFIRGLIVVQHPSRCFAYGLSHTVRI